MTLFLITQWGDDSDPDGPNAKKNTAVLVRAENLDQAVEIAETAFRAASPVRLKPRAAHAMELGHDIESGLPAQLLLGPVLVPQSANCGINKFWVRDYEHDGWSELRTGAG